jgi:hypothetical protein
VKATYKRFLRLVLLDPEGRTIPEVVAGHPGAYSVPSTLTSLAWEGSTTSTPTLGGWLADQVTRRAAELVRVDKDTTGRITHYTLEGLLEVPGEAVKRVAVRDSATSAELDAYPAALSFRLERMAGRLAERAWQQ